MTEQADTSPTTPPSTPGDPPAAPGTEPVDRNATGTARRESDLPGTGPAGRPSLGWTELAVGAVTYALFGFLVLPLIVVLIYGIPGPGFPAAPLLAASGLAALIAAAVALVVRVRWLPALGVRRTSVRWLLLGLLGGLVAKVLGTAISFGYIALTGDSSNPQQLLADSAASSGPALIGVLAFGAVLVPIGEELLFRGVAFGALRRYGMWLAVIASAVVFGLAHGINLVLPAALVLGLVNALIYERARSIWPAILSHAVFNSSAFLFAAFALG